MPSIHVECIWDRAQYCAFTDLVEFQGQLLCCFRESDVMESEDHVSGQNGIVRVIAKTGEWDSIAEMRQEGIDLRDPHFALISDHRLMIIMEGITYVDKKCVKREPYVTFSEDGIHYSPLQKVNQENEWIWRVTWNHGIGYGVSYKVPIDDPNKEWKLTLFSTNDGVNYTPLKIFDIKGHPSETTIRFLSDDTMVLLTRSEGCGSIGSSKPPYDTFTWHALDIPLGGPNFVVLPNNQMWAASRVNQGNDLENVALGPLSLDSYQPNILLMPSLGYDTSYPGMVYKDGIFYLSFYWSASEQSPASIYLAQVSLP